MFHVFYPPKDQPEFSFGLPRLSLFAVCKTTVIWINHLYAINNVAR